LLYPPFSSVNRNEENLAKELESEIKVCKAVQTGVRFIFFLAFVAAVVGALTKNGSVATCAFWCLLGGVMTSIGKCAEDGEREARGRLMVVEFTQNRGKSEKEATGVTSFMTFGLN